MTLDHIAVIVSKEENLEFYKKLGFKETNRFIRSYDTVVFMECDGIVLEVFIDPKHPERASGPEAKGLRHVAFNVDSLSNLPVDIEPIRTDFFGRKFTFTKDLDTESGVQTSSKYKDDFYELFFSKEIMNEACYECVSRSSIQKSDIRLGDFWGTRYIMDDEGVSAVVCNTEKGKSVFETVKEKFDTVEVLFNEVVEEQSYGKVHRYNFDRRSMILGLLSGNTPLRKIVYKYEKSLPVKRRAKIFAKAALKHLPRKTFMLLRKISHGIGE